MKIGVYSTGSINFVFFFFRFLKYARSKIWKYGEEKENMNDEWSFYNNKY